MQSWILLYLNYSPLFIIDTTLPFSIFSPTSFLSRSALCKLQLHDSWCFLIADILRIFNNPGFTIALFLSVPADP